MSDADAPATVLVVEDEPRLVRLVETLLTSIGAHVDVPAPDVNTDELMMAWFFDEYERRIGRQEPSVVTGKPVALGGI